MVLLSGHDSTLVPLLASLGLFEPHWPPYAAHVRIEVAHRRGGEGVTLTETMQSDAAAARLLYQGTPLTRSSDGGEAGWVSLEEFRALLRAAGTLSEAEYAEACAQSVASPSPAAQQADAGSLQDTLVGRPRSRM